MQLTFKQWVNSAVLTSVERYPHLRTNRHHSGLIIVYDKKHAIQDVERGFYIDNTRFSETLAEAETLLWDKINSI
jgi:hypothetical protein